MYLFAIFARSGNLSSSTVESKAEFGQLVSKKIITALTAVNQILGLHTRNRPLDVREVRALLSSLKKMLHIVRLCKTLGIIKRKPTQELRIAQQKDEAAADAKANAENVRLHEALLQAQREKLQRMPKQEDGCPSVHEICDFGLPVPSNCPRPLCPKGSEPTRPNNDGLVAQGASLVNSQDANFPLYSASAPQAHNVHRKRLL